MDTDEHRFCGSLVPTQERGKNHLCFKQETHERNVAIGG